MGTRKKNITFGTIFKRDTRYYFESKSHGIKKISLKTSNYDEAVQETLKRFGYLQLEDAKEQREQLLTMFEKTKENLSQAKKPKIQLDNIENEYREVLKRTSHNRRKLHADAKNKIPLADATLQSTFIILGKFKTWLKQGYPQMATMDEVTPVTADAFFAEVRDDKSAGTYNNYRGSLHVIWSRLAIRAGLDRNPFDGIKRLPKAVMNNENYPKGPFSLEQLGIVREKATGWLRPAVHIGYETGLRLSDVCTLRRNQLDLDGEFLDLSGQGTRKAGKEHIFYIPDAISHIREWLKTVANDSEYVFPKLAAAYLGLGRKRDRTLANKQFMRFLWETCKFDTSVHEYEEDKNGIPLENAEGEPVIKRRHSVLGFHSLRVSNATYSRTSGASVKTVQKQLGHSTQELTEGYIQEDIDAIKNRLITEHRPLPLVKATKLDTLKKLTETLTPEEVVEFREWFQAVAAKTDQTNA